MNPPSTLYARSIYTYMPCDHALRDLPLAYKPRHLKPKRRNQGGAGVSGKHRPALTGTTNRYSKTEEHLSACPERLAHPFEP